MPKFLFYTLCLHFDCFHFKLLFNRSTLITRILFFIYYMYCRLCVYMYVFVCSTMQNKQIKKWKNSTNLPTDILTIFVRTKCSVKLCALLAMWNKYWKRFALVNWFYMRSKGRAGFRIRWKHREQEIERESEWTREPIKC